MDFGKRVESPLEDKKELVKNFERRKKIIFMYCIDASVIVSSHLEREPYHKQSKAFLMMVEKKNLKVFLPEIIIPEITSGIFRATRDPKIAYELALSLRTIPNFSFVSIEIIS